ncbi:MAG: heterodisulfide reductase [Elusimicrobia bacterium GWC2_51_8]|nr:MAG: heterodisulfide reductase [Elusimicrobia bacterium GWA2_51_34]OGR60729.1 MAG: heterodisulfide reductase [Elusimicrobia bacterium GWC2_51_8]HCE98470.1 heterodisulfide reductase [Elusimicrobiota bacterium]
MPLERKVKYENECDKEFADWVTSQTGGENLRHCIQCGICSAACPLSLYMDYTPRRLINLARAGFKKEVLSSLTIWLCASCYACRVECPKEIQITDIMYLLKRKAIEEGVYPRRFPIPVLAREFGRMVFMFGRVNETLLVTDLFLRTNWFKFLSMTGLGLNLIRTGRMSYLPEHIKNRGQLRKIMNAIDTEAKKGETK